MGSKISAVERAKLSQGIIRQKNYSDEVSDRRIKKDELSDGANYPKITTDQVVGLGAVSATCCSLIIAETALKRILAEGNLQRQNKNIFIPFPHYIADVLNV